MKSRVVQRGLDLDYKVPVINCVKLRKWRGPSPSGHILTRTAALASLCRSGVSCAVVTPASTSHAEEKSSKVNSVISDSTEALIPAPSSSARNPDGSASAPGPTPG